ncbi:MAG: ATP-binding cassette domain-containing protein [Pseudomonadales bacterium]
MALVCHGLAKSYRQGSSVLEVLREINLAVRQGERIAIVGASGSGKSTLLGLLGLLDQPDGGKLVLRGCDPSGLNDAQISALRNRQLGFVYQFHHLLAEFTAQENVAMPLLIAGVDPREASKLAGRWLERVGLAARASHRPSELSGGERQRVAIARALVNQPGCVLMDEPTGNLDREAAGKVLSLLDTLSKESDTAFIVVTHDPSVAAVMDCIYELRDGILQTASSQSAAQQLAGEKQRGQR